MDEVVGLCGRSGVLWGEREECVGDVEALMLLKDYNIWGVGIVCMVGEGVKKRWWFGFGVCFD